MKAFLSNLAPHLASRTILAHDVAFNADGNFVLYWMHHSMRAHENATLDVALALGEHLNKPVLVYQGLGGSHKYNSDRHHMFVLQGARHVSRELAALNISYAFFLPHSNETSPLNQLAKRSAAIVCEMMPVPPFTQWQPHLAKTCERTLLQVDSRCIVPMPSLPQTYERAFEFRDATRDLFGPLIKNGWPTSTMASTGLAEQHVFEPLNVDDLSDTQMLSRIASLPIDHSVAPIVDTSGGGRHGYARWQHFLDQGLSSYHRRRNDAAQRWPLGVSRMSAYLHYGMVSTHKIANDALATEGAGAEKFLDELTIWRELTHNFCFHCEQPDTLDALPDWARKTLAEHASDEREETYDIETLRLGETSSALWNLAQRSLVAHGELHNDLRMTWAKAILQWTQSPAQALEYILDLNHRYALDGSDPASFGGVLWALGLFDRPFEPESPVFGAVRGRSLAAHERKLDLARYQAQVERVQGKPLRVAVIGAGISGLIAARTLAQHNHSVVVFEKARGPGGRTASRRRDGRRFDHGAQYFTARNPLMRELLPAWQQKGIVARWPEQLVRLDKTGAITARDDERWCGQPSMSAFARNFATNLDCNYNATIKGVRNDGTYWSLVDENDQAHEFFDALLISAPAPQTARLIQRVNPELAAKAANIDFSPCWAVMLATAESLSAYWQAAFVDDPMIEWVANDTGKLDASDTATLWCVHASAKYTRKNSEQSPERIAEQISERFSALTGLEVLADSAVAHLWRYARCENPLNNGCLIDEQQLLAICGDWCLGESRVENAWLSGVSAAARLIAASQSWRE